MLGISNLRYHRFLITLFRPVVTGSDDSECYQMTGELASPLLLLSSSLSAQSSFALR